MRRNWIKLYVDQCLRGTMMDEMKDPAERFLWFAFLLLAGDSPYEGKIALTEDIGYSDEQLGSMLKCDSALIKRAKKVMVKYDKIRILENNIIQIVNWKKYQSEYQRQKPYRSEDGQKLLRKVTLKGDAQIEIEKEKEKEIRKDNEKHIDLTKEMLQFFGQEFERYWKEYDTRGKQNKRYAKQRFMALCKQGKLDDFDKGFTGYSDFLKHKRTIENFDQRPKYFSTLISDYEEYIDFKYNPPM